MVANEGGQRGGLASPTSTLVSRKTLFSRVGDKKSSHHLVKSFLQKATKGTKYRADMKDRLTTQPSATSQLPSLFPSLSSVRINPRCVYMQNRRL